MSIEIDPDEPLPARTDLFSALGAMVFGGAVTVGAWRMDRLEHLHINKYEIPGLVPGLLGAAILVLGVVLALRSIARGALGASPPRPAGESQFRTMALVFALTLFYALGLVGTGVPFWLATFVFVSVFIFLFDRERQAGLGRSMPKQAVLALVYGAATSAVVSLSFEHIFLVRLP
jgi:hypothetical protein